jgi:spermidine synthase
VLLGTFMGGMCLGSLAFARIIPASFHPLRVYAMLELGIGLIAILVLYLLPPAADLYARIGGEGFTGTALLCAAFLLAPTVLMGATLQCAARWVERTPKGVSWLGILYTGNLAGAVFGCLLAGFYLLRIYDMATATFVAAAINALCAALAFALAAFAPQRAPEQATAVERAPLRWESAVVYLTIALSGMTALGAQVVWTRLLSLLLGTSVYTFSIILAVFLVGLGLGSSVGSLLARGTRNALVMLGWCQLFLVAAIAWAAFSIDAWLPYWLVDPRLGSNPWLTFQLDLARCLWAVLPSASLWGASFPLALAAAAPRHTDSGRMVGAVYAANTVGAIIGAVAFSIILIRRSARCGRSGS